MGPGGGPDRTGGRRAVIRFLLGAVYAEFLKPVIEAPIGIGDPLHPGVALGLLRLGLVGGPFTGQLVDLLVNAGIQSDPGVAALFQLQSIRDVIRILVAFLKACKTFGNGVPDHL